MLCETVENNPKYVLTAGEGNRRVEQRPQHAREEGRSRTRNRLNERALEQFVAVECEIVENPSEACDKQSRPVAFKDDHVQPAGMLCFLYTREIKEERIDRK